jgi:hypothetical protein
MTLRCDTCAAYEEWDNGLGRCHLFPPTQHRDVRNEMWMPYPMVQPDWWCAQHRPNSDPTRPNSDPTPAAVIHGPPPVEDDF